MANVIDDATIDYVGILAKLELSDEEKEQAKKDMASMLDILTSLMSLIQQALSLCHTYFLLKM